MKTLLVIASIILLSYQIDRFYSSDNAVVITEKATPALAAALSERNETTAEPVVFRSGVKLAENTKTVSAVEATKNTAKVVTRKTKLSFRQSKKASENFTSFHSRIKQSGNYIFLSSVQFNKNAYETVTADDFSTIMNFADQLIFDSTLKVSVAGFTDNTGNDQYNEELSLLRAVNIQRYLVDLGVPEEQIILSGNGVTNPIADNATEEGRSMNRRVELALIHNF